MWRGAEAFAEAEALVAVAEGHRKRQKEQQRETKPPLSEEFLSSRPRMLRPAEDARQARDFAQRGVQRSEGGGGTATPVGGAEARRVLPGVSLPFDGEGEESGGNSSSSQSLSAAAAALVVEGGLVVDPKAFLRHLWAATVEAAEAAGGSALLDSESPPVRSLAELDRGGEDGGEKSRSRRFDVVVVAAGAASGAVAEVGTETGVGSCELVQGWTATVAPPPSSSSSSSSSSPFPFPESALLGKTYAAPRRRRGNDDSSAAVVAVGATRSALPVSAAEALAHCASRGRGIVEGGPGAASEAEEASRELLERFARLWPPASAAGEGEGAETERKRWQVVSAASGVRARPRRSGAGRPPLAGKIESEGENDGSNWWVIGGLGSRGLLYAAWLGREVARAALADVPFLETDGGNGGGKGEGGQKREKSGDSSLDPELTRWKRWKKL